MTKVNKNDDGTVTIEGTISVEVMNKHKEAVLKNFVKDMELPGFRKGKVPENVVIERIGELPIWQAAAEKALQEEYPKIIESEKIEAIDRPEIDITKLAPGNEVEWKATQAVLPEVKLPDYKKLASDKLEKLNEESKGVEATDEEVEQVLTRLRTERKKNPTDEKEVMPALDDEFAKSLGDFKGVTDLKEKLKENIKHEKEHKERDRKRLEVMEAVMDATKMTLPKVMVERQIDNYMAEARGNIERMGLKYEDYLEKLGKKEPELREDMRGDAEKRVKSSLILSEIARTESLKADDKEVEAQANKIIEGYKASGPASPAGRQDSQVDPARVKDYVRNILLNEEVFKLLGA